MNENQSKLDVVDKALARNLDWIVAADAKIPPVFAITVAMLGVLVAMLPSANRWTPCVAILAFLAGVALLLSIACLAVASFPRLKGPKGSIVYFGAIITKTEDDYIKEISMGPTSELIEDIARQAYRNAEIAAAKYAAIKWAIALMFGSIPFWVIAVGLLYCSRLPGS